jgi:hypothetical protein
LTLQGAAAPGQSVAVYADGAAVGATTAGTDGKWTFDDTAHPLGTGSHAFTATTTDVAGNVSANSAALSVNVVPPTVTLTATLYHDTGVSASDNITNNGALALSGTATPGSTVTIMDGSTVFGTAYAHADGSWGLGGCLPAGVNQLTATATLNNLTSAAVAAQAITVDAAPPAAPAIASLTGGSTTAATGGSVPTGNVTLQGTAVANDTVTVSIDGVACGTAIVNTSGKWSLAASGLANGAHTVTATDADIAGNVSAASSGFSFTVAPPAPTVSLSASLYHDTGLSASDNITNNGAVALSGTATPGALVTIMDGSTVFGTAYAHADGSWGLGGGLPAGVNPLKAFATLNGVSSNTVSAQTITVDTTAPAAPSIASLTAGATVLGNNSSSASGAFVIQGAAEARAVVSLYADGALIGTAQADGTGHWSFDDTGKPLVTGSHALTAVATDLAGNASVASGAFNVNVTSSSVALNSVYTSGANDVVAGSGPTGGVVSLSQNGTTVYHTGATTAANWTLAFAPPTSVQTYQVSETNAAGARSANVELMVGTAKADTITALHAGDVIYGGGGGDTFVFNTTTASGAIVESFTSGSDHLVLSGFGAATQVVQLDTTRWQVSDGVHTDVIQLANGARLSASDWIVS